MGKSLKKDLELIALYEKRDAEAFQQISELKNSFAKIEQESSEYIAESLEGRYGFNMIKATGFGAVMAVIRMMRAEIIKLNAELDSVKAISNDWKDFAQRLAGVKEKIQVDEGNGRDFADQFYPRKK